MGAEPRPIIHRRVPFCNLIACILTDVPVGWCDSQVCASSQVQSEASLWLLHSTLWKSGTDAIGLRVLLLHIDACAIMSGGKVPEWTIGAVSKTAAGLAPPWVRIPPFPPARCRGACPRNGACRPWRGLPMARTRCTGESNQWRGRIVRSSAHDWKSCRCNSLAGSNPALSAWSC
jgi:hypothetical protein